MATAVEYGLMASLIALGSIQGGDKVWAEVQSPDFAFNFNAAPWTVSAAAIICFIAALYLFFSFSKLKKKLSRALKPSSPAPAHPVIIDNSRLKTERRTPGYDLGAALRRLDARPVRWWPENTTGAEKFNQQMKDARDKIAALRAEFEGVQDSKILTQGSLDTLNISLPDDLDEGSADINEADNDYLKPLLEQRDKLNVSLTEIGIKDADLRKKLQRELESLDANERALTRRLEIETGHPF